MKKTIIYSLSVILIAGMITGCGGLQKMVDNAKDVKYGTTPSPLEMHAGKVPVSVTVTFPPKYFAKNVKLVITPTLKSDDGSEEHSFPPQTIIGEKFKDNYPRISYKNGGSFSFKDTIDYKDAFRMSDMELKLMASTNKDQGVPVIALKIADGVKTTPELVMQGMAIDGGLKIVGSVIDDKGNLKKGDGVGQGSSAIVGKTVRVTTTKPTITYDSKEAKLFFDLQKSNVKNAELKSEDIKELVTFIKDAAGNAEKELKGVKIASYASPDGPEELNQGLVEKRGQSSGSAFKKALKKEGVSQVEEAEFISTETTQSEDWEGFKKEVAASDIEDKDLIIKVLSMYSDGDTREKEIKNLSAVYNSLRNKVLPKLRRSVIKFSYQSKAKTDEELSKIAVSNPEKLQQEELLYSANITDDLASKEKIYLSYTKSYPDDWRGWNNLAVAQTKQNKLSEAKVNFQKAEEAKSGNPQVLNNLGVIAMAEGDDDAAFDYFQKAIDAGESSGAPGYNMGVILIKRGQYAEALTNMGDATFNKALAQTLSGDNASAEATMVNLGSNDYAIFYYFKAVVAAKAGNEGDLMENLKIAVAKDDKLKGYAKKDVEFLKYFDNSDFKSIVQ